MNFFGHAHVASWFGAEPEFILGAMLPDLLSMLGRPRAHPVDETMGRGVELHHATDAAFHSIPEFVRLVAEARVTLSRAGLGRGPARASAHIGVELLLDEAVATHGHPYLRTLTYASRTDVPIQWEVVADAERFRSLIGALARHGLPNDSRDPAALAGRVRRALARHPRLAIGVDDERAFSEWVVAARPAVVGCSVAILTELRKRLLERGFGRVA